MIPFGSRDVTLIHRLLTKDANGRTVTSYKVYTLHGCSWRMSELRSGSDDYQDDRITISCRIPEINGVAPSNGDIIIKGVQSVTVNDQREFESLMDDFRGDAFKVSHVSDNTGPYCPIPHYAAKGE